KNIDLSSSVPCFKRLLFPCEGLAKTVLNQLKIFFVSVFKKEVFLLPLSISILNFFEFAIFIRENILYELYILELLLIICIYVKSKVQQHPSLVVVHLLF